jgi:hypothetical protein
VGFIQPNGAIMTNFKTLTAIVIFSAAVATPVFAQDANVTAPTHHARAVAPQNFRGAYNQVGGAPYDNAPQTREELINQQNFGFSGRNPARVGGENPDLNPPS